MTVVDALAKKTRLLAPAGMPSVPDANGDELFTPRAALAKTIEDRGRKHALIAQNRTVNARPVAADAGARLRGGSEDRVEGPCSGQYSLRAAVVMDIFEQFATRAENRSRAVAG